jgi:peptidoglycan/xylan/chitin deacetylase (PgdA/CDA1 family)
LRFHGLQKLMPARWAFELLSPGGPRARLSVLIFHRVLRVPDPMFPGEPDGVRFAAEMRWVKNWFNVVPLPEAIQRLRKGALPPRAAAITFDDGYADNVTVALPILQQVGLPATFFISAGHLNGGRMWNDAVIDMVREADGPELDLTRFELGRHAVNTVDERRRTVGELLSKLKYLESAERNSLVAELTEAANVPAKPDLMMTSEQVRTLSALGMTIGAHTVNHPILTRVSESEARAEIGEGKERLEAITGERVTLFAYPNGKPGTDYTHTHVELTRRAGFDGACSTGWGAATSGCDPYQIPRFTPWDRAQWRYALRLAQNMRRAVSR